MYSVIFRFVVLSLIFECSVCFGDDTYIIPDILSLEDYASIPNQILRGVDTVSIAESIIRRLEQRMQPLPNNIATVPVDFMADSQLMLFFASTSTASIVNSGEFFSAFQLGEGTRPDGHLGGRRQAARVLSTLDLGDSSIENEIKPKSVFVNVTARQPIGHYSDLPPFGNIIAVLQNDVKQRATFSFGDSFLNLQFYRRDIPSGDPHRGMLMSTFSFPRIHVADTSRYDAGYSYIEGEVFGRLRLANVREWLVMPPPQDAFVMGRRRAIDQSVEILKTTGLPISWANVSTQYQRKVVTRGETIIAGDLEVASKMQRKFRTPRRGKRFMVKLNECSAAKRASSID